ncbi:MAG: hypothetical protein ACRDJX_02300 [Solirubrobacteraceae bacterium]
MGAAVAALPGGRSCFTTDRHHDEIGVTCGGATSAALRRIDAT